MKIQNKDIGEILQKIYDSEIHFKIQWVWDAGIYYSIGDHVFVNSKMKEADRDIVESFEIICKDILKKFPESSFTKWFNGKFKNKKEE